MFELARALSAGLLDFGTAFLFFATWLRPEWLGRHWVKSLMLVMLVEFLVIHSFGFLFAFTQESGTRSILGLLGIGAFYLLFAAAFGAAFRSWWPLLLFGWLIGSKLFGLLTGAVMPADQAAYVTSVWVVSTVAYLLLVAFTTLMPLPRLGVREHARNYGVDPAATGLWMEQPHRVIAFGALYFSVVGIARVMLAPAA